MTDLSAYLATAQERAEFALTLESPGLVRDQSLEVLAMVAVLRDIERLCDEAERGELVGSVIDPSLLRAALSSLTPDTPRSE